MCVCVGGWVWVWRKVSLHAFISNQLHRYIHSYALTHIHTYTYMHTHTQVGIWVNNPVETEDEAETYQRGIIYYVKENR